MPLTAGDLDNWVTTSARSYAASGIAAGQRIVTTYNAGPFAAGAALAAFDRIGLCHIPFGTGNSERLLPTIERLGPEAAVLTPSYAAHLVELADERGVDLRGLERRARARGRRARRRRGGVPREAREAGWGAKVTEAMGVGDIGVSLFGECEEQDGMHLGARGIVHVELVDPESGAAVDTRGRRERRARPHAPPAPRRAAPALSHARPRRGADDARAPAAARGRASAASGGPTTCSSSAASTSSPRRCARS